MNPFGDSSRFSGLALSLFRIMTALLFMQHGTQKLLGFPTAYTYGSTAPFTFMWFTGMLELVGGLLILIGLFTRPVAFILSGMMAVAYFMAHAPRGFFPIVNEGELAIMFCFGFLLLSAAGPGTPSADALLRRRRSAARPD